MTQLEKFSLHLPYKPKMKEIYWSISKGENVSRIVYLKYRNIQDASEQKNEYKPYLRSFDQLTKECVQADYNDGKPFVPQEIMPHLDLEWLITSSYPQKLVLSLDFRDVLQLLKWHFAIGFEQGEYIEVTNENNHY